MDARAKFCFLVLRDAMTRALTVAAAFWATWLVLVSVELTMGSSVYVGVSFLTSIPLLVIFVTWTSRRVIFLVEQRLLGLTVLGCTVLTIAATIIGVGMLATAGLKALVQS